MTFSLLRRDRGPVAAAGIAVCLVLAAILLVPEAGPSLHLHEDETAGIYDEQCPLLSLAGVGRDAAVADRWLAPGVVVVPGVLSLAAAPAAPAPLFRSAASRAPPAA